MERALCLYFSVVLCCLSFLFNARATHAQRVQVRKPATQSDENTAGLSATARSAMDAAVANLQQGAFAEAERAARQAVSAAPRSAVAHNLLGVVLDRAGHAEEGYAEFSTAIRLDPKFVSALNNLARHLAERGQAKEAITQFERVLKLDPAHIQAHYNLGTLYADAGDFAKAAEHFAQARKAEPNDPQLALAFLNVAYRANRSAEADAAAVLVESAVGADARGLFTLEAALAQAGKYEHAARLFARVNELTPHTFEVLYNLGVALYNLDHNDEAAMYLAEAADLNPGPAETHLRLGLIASARNDSVNAITELRHVLERDGKKPSTIFFWAGSISELVIGTERSANTQ